MVDKDLQKARQDWFLSEMRSLKIDNVQADIVDKTGYKKQTINGYVKNVRPISVDFMRTFCEAYGYNFEAVNHLLIEGLKNQIIGEQANPITEKSKEKNKEILSTDNDNLLASHHTKNDEPMTDRLIDLLQKQHEGLLQAHRELIAKITNITLDEKKEFGKSPKHPAH